jgi:Terminase large subunit, T4likevirus-type, N-terminal/Terminase RNaseH-like domain
MSRTAAPEAPNLRPSALANTPAQKKIPVSLQLPASHPKQYELINAFETVGCRFIVGACGSKFGKTFGCSSRIIKEAWDNKDSLNWWVAPTFAQSKMAFATIKKLLPKGFYHEYKADLKLVILEPDGSERSVIEFKSGDNPDSLRGFGVNFAIMDEAARQPYDSFVSVWTTLTQTMGRAIFISTPKGRGWFYDVYQRGEVLREEYPEWYSIRMPTWLNPHVKLEAIEQFKRNMPEDVFRQEVAAQFLLDSAGVFRGIKHCVRGVLEEPLPGHSYVMGVDLARLRDFSVLTVMDRERKHVVYFERFNKIDWAVQYARIIDVAKRYNAVAVMDSTGIGDPIVETIKSAGVRVEPYKIGGSTAKQQLIEKLRVSIENGRISFPNVPVMVRELENYEYEISETGIVKYSAPEGFHDDCVISLALANWMVDTAPFIYRYKSVRGI